MAAKLETDYVVAAGDISLSVIIGDGQLGSSLVRLGDEELAIGDVDRLKIGSGGAIAGKDLFIKTVVTDVNDNTDHTSVRYELKGGKADKVFDLEESADEEGGSVVYRATFTLKS
jgi:Icc-related predicted phosphoesterase